MGTKLFVGNLAYSITEQELREAFGNGGRTVQSVRIALDRETQRPRGFAFIELANDTEADAAIKELNGQMLSGRNVFVEKAQERVPGAPRPPRPAGGPGGFNRGPGGPGGGPGGFRPGGPRPGGPGGGGFGRPRFAPPVASMETNKEDQRRRQSRPEKRNEKKRPGEGRPKEEDMIRGKWRWDGSDD